MKMENIRENFSNMDEVQQRQFFLTYAEKREHDFTTSANTKIVKLKKSSKKEAKLKVSTEQLALLKALNLV